MDVPDRSPLFRPSLRVGRGATPLGDELRTKVQRAVVDSRVNMPTMIEVTFADGDADVLDRAGITFGTPVEVWTEDADDTRGARVGAGEVVAVEGRYSHDSMLTVVRAYDRAHQLHRSSRTRTFMNQTDSDIARKIASDAGLRIGTITATSVSHVHLGQSNQTDWQFLNWRCRQIGYEFGVDDDGFFFRPLVAAKRSTVDLQLRGNLLAFAPRVTSGNLTAKVEMRFWDPLKGKVVSSQTETESVGEPAELSGAGVSDALNSVSRPGRPPAPASGDQSLGPAPVPNALVMTSMAPASGAAIDAAAKEASQGPARRLASSFTEARGTAWGDPRLQVGTGVRVSGVPDPFSGLWTVAAVEHVFDHLENGYRTTFRLGNPEDRTLLGLASGAGGLDTTPLVQGLMCGVVSDVNDPLALGRIKVSLPLLHPDYVTDWAPVAQQGGGKRAGTLVLPEIGDQVLLGFEQGDPGRPYVVGGVLSEGSVYKPGGPAVEATGSTAEVVRRGMVSPSGNMLAFHDKMPPGEGQPPKESAFVLGTADVSIGLAVDQVAGTLTLTCAPKTPNSKTAEGTLDIRCGDGGTVNITAGSKGKVNITAGSGGELNIDGGSKLRLTAQSSVTIESSGSVALKGSSIDLN
ncbi:phage baseplate assembly protein V [Streptomyces sp. NPDC090303]|uniref:phage baseplate assembly protein V n=1 Tax=Streptomyces sp. NPDC090303 TaxID=3365960 RepID=UPI0037F7F6B0